MLVVTVIFSGYLATSLFLTQLDGTTKESCSQACFLNTDCSSFFFNNVTGFCQLEKFVYTNTNGLSVANDVIYLTIGHKSCPEDYTYSRYTKKCLKYYDIGKSFSDASTMCEGDSAHLLFPTSEDLNTQAVIMMKTNRIWIGAHKVSEGVWEWLNGQSLGPYTNWMSGKPDGDDAAFLQGNKLWDDQHAYQNFHFICESDAGQITGEVWFRFENGSNGNRFDVPSPKLRLLQCESLVLVYYCQG